MNDDIQTAPYLLNEEEEYSMCLMVSEPPYKELSLLLEELPRMKGSSFVKQLKEITSHNEFKPLEDENDIFIAGGKTAEDYSNLLNAARKAVAYGYRVFILPNPRGIRTADYIFERKGVYRLYDLKTIQGKASAVNRMIDSINQTNRVLLNMTSDYNARLLASDIKTYFENNPDAIEVLIFKGNKVISVKRGLVENKTFNRIFRKIYEK